MADFTYDDIENAVFYIEHHGFGASVDMDARVLWAARQHAEALHDRERYGARYSP